MVIAGMKEPARVAVRNRLVDRVRQISCGTHAPVNVNAPTLLAAVH